VSQDYSRNWPVRYTGKLEQFKSSPAHHQEVRSSQLCHQLVGPVEPGAHLLEVEGLTTTPWSPWSTGGTSCHTAARSYWESAERSAADLVHSSCSPLLPSNRPFNSRKR